MKILSALPTTLPSAALSHQPAVADIWLRLADQPLLRIGWIAMAGHQLFDYLGNVALSRVWVCHAPISARATPDSAFGQVLATIRSSGLAQPEQTITFDAFLPGYQATVGKYLHSCWQCLLVEDWAGQYIYLWAKDSASLPHPARLLTHCRENKPIFH